MNSSRDQKVVIIGGGLAGLTCAIHLLRSGIAVTVIEKNTYPQHKVCGEYISNEVLPYLESLNIDIRPLKPAWITKLQFSDPSGRSINCDLPLGGFGISRYVLDEFLYKTALKLGCMVLTDTVEAISYQDGFNVHTKSGILINAGFVIAAYGKRSPLDQKLGRSFISKKSPWLAVKAHYSGDFPDDMVGLHNFNGGYCGVSKVEDDRINICYLTDYKSFKAYKNIEDFQQAVLCANPLLKQVLDSALCLFEQPLTISQVSFERKLPVEDHIFMIGDTAGLIHPLCGNGMAMAIHSAKLCAETLEGYFEAKGLYQGQIPATSRKLLERQYTEKWRKMFSKRLLTGRILATLLRKAYISKPLFTLLVRFPSALPLIVKMTHGKPIR